MAFLEDVIAAFPELSLDSATERSGHSKLAIAGTKDGQPVMLKVLKDPVPERDVESAEDDNAALQGERFRREVLAMRGVKSPRVVAIISGPEVRKIGQNDHLWYLEPRYETTLADHLTELWSEARVVALIEDLASGLIALQGHHIVHRDIKPSNIGIEADGRPVLLDLGAALFTEMTTYTVGIAPHTRQFAAPEQLYPRRRGSIDARTDMFAVGIVAFIALARKHPFGSYRADPAAFEQRVQRGEYDREALAQANCSPELRSLLDRLLKPRQNQRFRHVAQLRAALRKCQR